MFNGALSFKSNTAQGILYTKCSGGFIDILFGLQKKRGNNYCKVNTLDTQKIVVINTTTNNPKSQFDVAFKSPLTV